MRTVAAVALAQDTTAATTAAAGTTADTACLEKFSKGVVDCGTTFAKCSTDAGGDAAKTCACFKESTACVKKLTPCSTATVAPGTTVDAEAKKKAIDTCVMTSKCTAAECEAALSSSSSLVASFSVLAAVVASRLF